MPNNIPEAPPSAAAALFACLATALLTCSCGIFAAKPPPKAKAVLYEWQDDGGPGDVAVSIHLGSQTASYHRGGRPIGWSYVCTGKPGHATSPGEYTITEMLELKHSDRYGWIADASGNVTHADAKPTTPVPPGEFYHPAPMPSWMRITSYGVGLHAGEIPRPGRPDSHGCVRLPREFAPVLYQAVKIGTPVKIEAGKRPPPI